ncbi:hypothetical protein D0C36_04230 [Mucilaginibacter conchicola]|uniref:Outer membrane protein beta-barrel domain-containing protein n=1 Tax=Mucilaginibacter conchicola TaxID=2303333 RepID=A0A372NY06_9SPHI|nr:hypothetical protein [Mucilaginibacter conchicola]RFZ94751.1 hypothetical protein D0C36_04230 [Mucilaginibacter conchicola]
MKKILTLIIIMITAFAVTASAQSKKAKTRKKVATQTTTVTKPDDKKAVVTETRSTTTSASSAAPAKHSVTPSYDDYYKTALGIKFLYGISITGKHFLNEKGALEGILQYHSLGDLGSEINFTALYEHHGKIAGAPGLRWYVGGGGYFGYLNVDSDNQFIADEASTTSFGVVGALGLEYKIKNVPIAISADWQPVYVVNNGGGFTSANGGFGIKYTF